MKLEETEETQLGSGEVTFSFFSLGQDSKVFSMLSVLVASFRYTLLHLPPTFSLLRFVVRSSEFEIYLGCWVLRALEVGGRTCLGQASDGSMMYFVLVHTLSPLR